MNKWKVLKMSDVDRVLRVAKNCDNLMERGELGMMCGTLQETGDADYSPPHNQWD